MNKKTMAGLFGKTAISFMHALKDKIGRFSKGFDVSLDEDVSHRVDRTMDSCKEVLNKLGVAKKCDWVNLTESNGNYRPGMRYLATVKAVRAEGVNVVMPKDEGCGVVSTRCWGAGLARERALSALSVGDTLEVVVKSYHAPTKTLSLLLANSVNKLSKGNVKRRSMLKVPQKATLAAKQISKNSTPSSFEKKPVYRPIPVGTTFLIDTANLIGSLGPEHAEHKLSVVEKTLSERGYKVVFFVEYKAMGWMQANQKSLDESIALKVFFDKSNVSKVNGEADLPILQASEQITNSVIVTRDHLADYGETYPDIVGSDRHRGFSFALIEGKTLLTICGLRQAIVIEDEISPVESQSTVVEMTRVDKSEDEKNADPLMLEIAKEDDAAVLSDARKGLLGRGDAFREKGDMKKALACYERIAKWEPAACFEIADIYDSGMEGYDDVRVSSKYVRLGQKKQRQYRQYARRCARLRAEGRRLNGGCRDLKKVAA